TLTRQATLVRRCRDFYARRLRQSELLRRKWHESSGSDGDCSSTTSTLSSASSSSASSSAAQKDNTSECRLGGGSEEQAGWRKSSLDLAMDSLRKEISCLMERDNALFGQLLGLHQSIADLRAQRQQHWLHHRPSTLVDDSDEDDEEDDDDDDVSSTGPAPSPRTPGSLESLSAYEEDRLTLSSSASSSDSRDQQSTRRSTGGPASHCASSACWRCVRGPRASVLPPGFRTRRALSQASLVLRHEHADSYDSGIQLQGSHSESDHEVFV
ncbi:unnamed protein product, partial [Ixodes hexagonus]